MYKQFVRDILFPLQERLKHHDTVRRFKALQRTQYASLDTLFSLQEKRLQVLLTHAVTQNTFYKTFLKLSLEEARAFTIDKLPTLPLLNKSDIVGAQQAIRSEGSFRLEKTNTGGSTGEPLVFYRPMSRISHDVAAKWRATTWWDVDIGDKEIVIWAAPHECHSQAYIKKLRDKLFRTLLCPAATLDRAGAIDILRKIKRYRPAMLFGYPSLLALLAQTALDEKIDMTDNQLKVAFVTSEYLYPHQESLITRVFDCPVANGYGGRDAGFIAHECPAGSMHLSFEDIIVEVIDKTGRPLPTGQTGELVVTHLQSAGFPFIRYRTGDTGAIETSGCACGRTLPRLVNLEGRQSDLLVGADGRLCHRAEVNQIVLSHEDILAYKIVQSSLNHIKMEVVLRVPLYADLQLSLSTALTKLLGHSITLTLNSVKEIAPDSNGKYRFIISHVSKATA